MHLAYDDELIGCRNFNKFLLDAANRTAPSGDCRTAVWYCDLKRFKYFNDMFGYQTGDDILRCLASAIETVGGEISSSAALPRTISPACCRIGTSAS